LAGALIRVGWGRLPKKSWQGDMAKGLGLLDIKPRTEEVAIDTEQSLTVQAISTETCFQLLERFPSLLSIFSGSMPSVAEIRGSGPEAIAAIIACAVVNSDGKLSPFGHDEAERAAAALPMEAQLDLLAAIGRVTFKDGIIPFVQRLASMLEGGGLVTKAPAGNSHMPSPTSSDAAIPIPGS
jgi:hypothetical protein